MEQIGAIGYAHIYLSRCKKESKSDDEIDIQVYSQLVKLDSRLCTKTTEQLFECVYYTQRLDLVKVWNSLGRVYLFLTLPKKQFLRFLYVPLLRTTWKGKITELIGKEPILSLISKMTLIKKRFDLPAIRNKLQSVEQFMNLRVVQTQAILFLKSMSERCGSDISHKFIIQF